MYRVKVFDALGPIGPVKEHSFVTKSAAQAYVEQLERCTLGRFSGVLVDVQLDADLDAAEAAAYRRLP